MTLDDQILNARRQGLIASEIADRLGTTIWRVHCALERAPRRLRFLGADMGRGEPNGYELRTVARKRGAE